MIVSVRTAKSRTVLLPTVPLPHSPCRQCPCLQLPQQTLPLPLGGTTADSLAAAARGTVLQVLMAFWVEKAERQSYKMSKLYVTEKECRAQSEADWRKAAAERHESDIAKTEAQTELRTRSHFVAWIFHEIRNPLNAM